jgi:hypothetical protein
MATLLEIDKLTKEFADAWDSMGDTLRDLNQKQEALSRQYMPGLRKQERILAEKKDALETALKDSADLFTRPRSLVLHGFKVGLRKGSGALTWAKKATAKIVTLIKKHYPDRADLYIRTVEEPNKDALKPLSAAELMKLGITVGKTGDEPLIEPVESHVEKLMKLYLKESKKTGEEDIEEEAA